jgi:hypothetical protein
MEQTLLSSPQKAMRRGLVTWTYWKRSKVVERGKEGNEREYGEYIIVKV